MKRKNFMRSPVAQAVIFSLSIFLANNVLATTQGTGAINLDPMALGVVVNDSYRPLFEKGEAGSDNVTFWRIPSLIRTQNGTLIAAADKRWQHRGDWGDIDTAIRISHDDGKTWLPIRTIIDLAGAKEGVPKTKFGTNSITYNPWGARNKETSCEGGCDAAYLIDPVMVQDKKTGRIFLAVDMQLDAAGLWNFTHNGDGSGTGSVKTPSGKYLMKLYRGTTDTDFRLRDNGEVIDANGDLTEYRVITKGDPSKNFKDLGDIYKSGQKVGNVYLRKKKDNPFNIADTGYIWLTHSDDEGKTWSSPVNISRQFKKDWMRFIGVGPGVGIQTKNGNLIIPIYFVNKGNAERPAVIISQDGGATWEMSASPKTSSGENTIRVGSKDYGYTPLSESQVVELDNGQLKLFMRNQKGKAMVSTSTDGGRTWGVAEQIPELDHGYSQLSLIKYSKTIDGKEILIYAGQSRSGQSGDGLRRDGKVLLGEVQKDGTIVWKKDRLMKEIKTGDAGKSLNQGVSYTNGFVYSTMAELGNGNIGIAYEPTVDYTRVDYLEFDLAELFYRDGKIFSDSRQKGREFSYNGEVLLTKIGDGTAIKKGVGEAKGSIDVNEGVLVLHQQADDKGKSKAFSTVRLKSGSLKVRGKQSIDRLEFTHDGDGVLSLDAESGNRLVVLGDIKVVGERYVAKPFTGKTVAQRMTKKASGYEDDWLNNLKGQDTYQNPEYKKVIDESLKQNQDYREELVAKQAEYDAELTAHQSKEKEQQAAFEAEQEKQIAATNPQIKLILTGNPQSHEEDIVSFGDDNGTSLLHAHTTNATLILGLAVEDELFGYDLRKNGERGYRLQAGRMSAQASGYVFAPVQMQSSARLVSDAFSHGIEGLEQGVMVKALAGSHNMSAHMLGGELRAQSVDKGIVIGGSYPLKLANLALGLSYNHSSLYRQSQEHNSLNSFGVHLNLNSRIDSIRADITLGSQYHYGRVSHQGINGWGVQVLGRLGYVWQIGDAHLTPEVGFGYHHNLINSSVVSYQGFNGFTSAVGVATGIERENYALNARIGYEHKVGEKPLLSRGKRSIEGVSFDVPYRVELKFTYKFTPALSLGLELGGRFGNHQAAYGASNLNFNF